MDNRTLHAFLVLADTLHFTRAASACHMSPSTLSRNIKRLETTLGVRLFERDNRRVTLTTEGALFRRYARESLDLFESFQNSLMDETRELTGEITMYCSVTASYSFLFELLAEFQSRHPRIRIKLQTGDPEQAVARVVAGEAQISIGARPARLPPTLAFKSMTSTPLVFIAAHGSTGMHSVPDPATQEDWARVPMILPETGVARDYIDTWFRLRDVTPRLRAQVAGNEAIVSMASLGHGVGVVPKIVLQNNPLANRVRMLAITPPLDSLEVGLFVLNRSLTNRAIAALWDANP